LGKISNFMNQMCLNLDGSRGIWLKISNS
jgi:hypothetical protein